MQNQKLKTKPFFSPLCLWRGVGGEVRAFTLVELIVVIVILAILSTIAFLSFNSYSAGARDSVRLGDLNNISKGLVLFYTNSGRYPIPDNYITITASGTNIGYQGYAGLKTLGIINLSNGGKDPLDTNTYYTYNTNINQNKYQLMGFLEDGSNSALSYVLDGKENGYGSNYSLNDNSNVILSLFQDPSILTHNGYGNKFSMTNDKLNTNIDLINQTYSDSNDYSKRYPYIKGDQLGILLNSGTQLPIQYNNSNTGFELTSATGTNYIAYISKSTIINSTGSMIGGLAGFYTVTQASSTYPGCDTPDIKLSNGQVWAACNVGASRAWNNQVTIQGCGGSTTDCVSNARYALGSYFQWGRNDDITATSTTGSISLAGILANNVGHNYFINGAVDYNYDWIYSRNPDLWGGTGTTYTSGTYYTRGNPGTMQGPCVSGYHIPTMLEWSNVGLSINPSLIPSFGAGRQNDITLINLLKIPLAGYRHYSNGTYMAQGIYGHYWASSSTNTLGHFMLFKYNGLYINNGTYRAGGFSVRCLKN